MCVCVCARVRVRVRVGGKACEAMPQKDDLDDDDDVAKMTT